MQLAKAPSSAVAAPAAAPKVAQPETAVSEGGIDEDLKPRLDNLKKIQFSHNMKDAANSFNLV